MPHKKIESQISLADRRWLNREQSADVIGRSIEYFDSRVADYIPFIVFDKARNATKTYDRQDIDRFMERLKQKPLKQLPQ